MTTSIKSFILFFAVILVAACSNETSKNTPIDKSAVPSEFTKADEPKATSTKTIAGRVTSIEFGKDGYVAAVETEDQGTYDALVSIVNLGGPDNYQTVNIGDRVVFTGTPSYAMATPSLKVEKIDAVKTGKTQLLIAPNAFRGITVGDKIAMHTDYIQKEQLKDGEGTFEIYRIKDFNNNPAGYLMPDPNDESLVGDITVESPMAATAKDIKIGSTFSDLKAAIPNMEVHGSEIEGRTYATANNISYRLDSPNFTYEVDVAKIPATSKIIEIVINRGYENTNALVEKYSAIQPKEYCWLVNDKMPLYTKPNTASKIQGDHFKGEVLSVLDSKEIDGEVWVNVEFKLAVKTGYEDQFADGQVHSTGEPTGWIGGATSPLINCK